MDTTATTDIPMDATTTAEKAKRKSKSATAILALPPKAFMEYLEDRKPSYNTLRTYRNLLWSAPEEAMSRSARSSKLRAVENRMNELVSSGAAAGKRRVPGTGKRVEKTFTYADTPQNQKLSRVGQTYTRVEWEGAEYKSVERKKLRRRRRTTKTDADGNPVVREPSLWIVAHTQAKNERGITGFSRVLSKLPENPTADEITAHEVYMRAKEIMAELKAKRDAERPPAPAQPPAETSDAAQETAEQPPKKRRRRSTAAAPVPISA